MPTTPSTSQQQNGIDCGVFATFTHFMSVDATEPDFHQGDVPHLRIRFLLSILDTTTWDLDHGSLDSDPHWARTPALRALLQGAPRGQRYRVLSPCARQAGVRAHENQARENDRLLFDEEPRGAVAGRGITLSHDWKVCWNLAWKGLCDLDPPPSTSFPTTTTRTFSSTV